MWIRIRQHDADPTESGSTTLIYASDISKQDNVVAKGTLDHVLGSHHIGTWVLIPCHYSLQFWYGTYPR
jgi:hypothetical protein